MLKILNPSFWKPASKKPLGPTNLKTKCKGTRALRLLGSPFQRISVFYKLPSFAQGRNQHILEHVISFILFHEDASPWYRNRMRNES